MYIYIYIYVYVLNLCSNFGRKFMSESGTFRVASKGNACRKPDRSSETRHRGARSLCRTPIADSAASTARGGGSRPDAAGTRQTGDSLPLASRRGRIPGIPTRVLNARSAPTRQFIRRGVLSFAPVDPVSPSRSVFLSLHASSYLRLSVFSGPDRAEHGRIPRQRRGVHGGCRGRAQ